MACTVHSELHYSECIHTVRCITHGMHFTEPDALLRGCTAHSEVYYSECIAHSEVRYLQDALRAVRYITHRTHCTQ